MRCPLVARLLSVLVFAIPLLPELSVANELSEEALFHRCYSHITGKRPALNHASIAKIRNSQSTALEECSRILDLVDLNPSTGLLKDVTGLPNAERNDVFNNLHRFHSSWFGIRDFGSFNGAGLVNRVFDVGEAGLYVTRSFFAEESVDILLTANQAPLGLRVNHLTLTRSDYQTTDGANNASFPDIVSTAANSYLVQTGRLAGVTWRTSAHAFKLSEHIPATSPAAMTNGLKNNFNNLRTSALHTSQNSSIHFGNGILGLQSYFMMNFGHPGSSNGAGKHARSWARNVISDLLCRDIPVIRLNDLKPHHVNLASNISYRTDASCMRCHATIDPMGATVRNFEVVDSPHVLRQFQNLMWVRRETPSMGNLNIMNIDNEGGNANFHKYNPTGEFMMRSFDGKLIDKTLNNHSQLAQALLDTDDFYVCAASRYFNFFTGVKVSLQDIGDPEATLMDEDELHYRNMVIDLGLRLKQHKNLKTLVKDIWNLPVYRKSGLRDLKEAN